MAEMPPSDSTWCRRPASKHCSGCAEGLDVHDELLDPPRYCSTSCQTSHWKAGHKQSCKQANGRKHLYQAGELAQELYYRFRAAAYDVKIGGVEKQDHDQTLHVYELSPGTNHASTLAWQPELFASERDRKAMLVWKTGYEWPWLMHEAPRRFFQSLKVEVREISFYISSGSQYVVYHHADGKGDDGMDAHAALLVKFEGETYALDLSAAELKSASTVMPWSTYSEHVVLVLVAPASFGYHLEHNLSTMNDLLRSEGGLELSQGPAALDVGHSLMANAMLERVVAFLHAQATTPATMLGRSRKDIDELLLRQCVAAADAGMAELKREIDNVSGIDGYLLNLFEEEDGGLRVGHGALADLVIQYRHKMSGDNVQLKATALLAQKLFYFWRQAGFEMLIKRVEKKASKLHVYDTDANGRTLVPFNTKQFTRNEDNEAVFAWNACADAVGKMSGLIRSGFEGLDVKVEEVLFVPKPGLRRLVWHYSNGRGTDEARAALYDEHIIFRVTHAGEKFALDLAGAQYGQHEPIIPWPQYEQKLVSQIVAVRPFGDQVARQEHLRFDTLRMTDDGDVLLDYDGSVCFTHWALSVALEQGSKVVLRKSGSTLADLCRVPAAKGGSGFLNYINAAKSLLQHVTAEGKSTGSLTEWIFQQLGNAGMKNDVYKKQTNAAHATIAMPDWCEETAKAVGMQMKTLLEDGPQSKVSSQQDTLEDRLRRMGIGGVVKGVHMYP